MDDFEAIAGDLLTPLAGAHPAGIDARHDPEHESLRAELDKLNSLAQAAISWPDVDRLATSILKTKSKDILAASYGAAAWMELSGIPGLLRGVAAVGGLLTRFPDSAFPLRARARSNAIAWLVERASTWIDDHEGLGLDHGTFQTLERVVSQTATAARTALGEDCPSFTSLERAVGRLAIAAPTLPVPAQHTSQPAEPAPLPAPAPAAPEPRSDSEKERAEGAAEDTERAHAASWLKPLSRDARCGVDLAYDDAFADLQLQIGRLESPTADPPDWKRVRDVADELLRSRSKDLCVASYLGAALLELEGLAGLTRGVWLVNGLCEQFWDDMWPSVARMRRRASAFVWFVSRVGTRVLQLSPRATQSQLVAFESALAVLGTFAPRFGDDAANLRKLTEYAARARADLPAQATPAQQPALAPPSRPEPPAASEPVAPPPPSRPAPVAELPEAPAEAPTESAQVMPFLRTLGERLVQTSRILRAANRADPAAYRLLRQGVWLHIDKAPPRDAERRTRIPAPQKRVVDALASLAAGEKWDALLTQAEGTVPSSPLWMDLHWYAARALSGLGADHDVARQALERETRALVQRLPELFDASFQDGSPLASAGARSWLDPKPAAHAQPSAPSSEEPTGLTGDQLALVTAGTKEGLSKVQEAIQGHRDERRRFLCRFDLAQGLATAGRAEQALAVYRGLSSDVERFALDLWEPALAARLLTAYWTCLRGLESPPGVVSDEGRSLCAKLARLAPEALFD